MANGQRVLVVDGLSETEEVLKAVLEPRGLRVDRVCGGRNRSAEENRSRPHVVVLHADDTPNGRTRRGSWSDVPCVVIGSARFSDESSAAGGSHYLQKPFCYRELIRAIEDLLSRPGRS